MLVPVFNSVILLSCLCYVHLLNNSCMIPVWEYVLFRIARVILNFLVTGVHMFFDVLLYLLY